MKKVFTYMLIPNTTWISATAWRNVLVLVYKLSGTPKSASVKDEGYQPLPEDSVRPLSMALLPMGV